MRFLFFILFALVSLVAKGNDSLSCMGKTDKGGKKHGVWICRNNEGKLIKKERFKHGKLSTWMLYNAKGQMVQSMDSKGRIRKFTPCGC